MPIDLVLVRHGQSEQNLASSQSKQGDASLYRDDFKSTPNSQYRLTDKGREQAKKAGEWLAQNDLGHFDRCYTSPYARAMETAAYLGLENARWYLEVLLREREWGDFDGLSWEQRQAKERDSLRHRKTDPFFWKPPNGESIADVRLRLIPLLSTLHRECADKRVVIVCHGEVMWTLRFILERMSIRRWVDLEDSREPGEKIHNGQVIHYTRRNPTSGELLNYLGWLRSISPTTPANSSPGWLKVERRSASNEDLLEMVHESPLLFERTAE